MIGDADQTANCVIELANTPIGFIQFYRWNDFPEDVALLEGMTLPDTAWGLDVFIGDAGAVGRGVGSRAVGVLCSHLEEERGATEILLVTDVTNHRAHRAYEKVGFATVKEILDTDTRDGERVRSYVMRRAGRPA